MQSVWLATPSAHQYKIVDITGKPDQRHGEGEEAIAHAPNGAGAIITVVALAGSTQRRVASMCRINMDILFVID